MSVINITNINFQDEVVNATQKVLLDFWAPWCGPCRMVSPVIDDIAKECPDCGEELEFDLDEVEEDEIPF